MMIRVAFFLDGKIRHTKTMSEVPAVGDEVVIGKSVSPDVFRVVSRRWNDSVDDFDRVDLACEPTMETLKKRRKK